MEQAGQSLRGIVLGSDGKPVVGAEVTCFDFDSLHFRQTVSDEKGRYELHGLGDSGPVVYRAANHAVQVAPLEFIGSEHDVALTQGVTYFGRLHDGAGRPLLQEHIKVVKNEANDLPFPLPETTTGSEGRFVLRCVPVGPMMLLVRGHVHAVEGEDGEVKEVNLALGPGE